MPSKKQKQKRKEKRDELYLANKWLSESFTKHVKFTKGFVLRKIVKRVEHESDHNRAQKLVVWSY
jgi:hypothetical protein